MKATSLAFLCLEFHLEDLSSRETEDQMLLCVSKTCLSWWLRVWLRVWKDLVLVHTVFSPRMALSVLVSSRFRLKCVK